jgi:hypothetical protein
MQQPPERRKADVALALRLAHEPGALFEVAERYSPSRIAGAVTHVSQAGRAGVVRIRIDFSKDWEAASWTGAAIGRAFSNALLASVARGTGADLALDLWGANTDPEGLSH